MRRLLITIAILIGLFVVVDRLAAFAASRALATEVQRSQGLASKPGVTIGGFPFLPQAFSGDYRSITVRIDGLHPDSIRIARVTAHLHGVKVPLSDVLRGSVTSVPVSSVDATARLAYTDLSRTVNGVALRVAPAPDNEVKVAGTVSAFGFDVAASALCAVSASGSQLNVTVRSVEVAGIPIGDEITSLVRQDFGFTDNLTLPFGLHLTGAQVQKDGVIVSAAGSGLVLHR